RVSRSHAEAHDRYLAWPVAEGLDGRVNLLASELTVQRIEKCVGLVVSGRSVPVVKIDSNDAVALLRKAIHGLFVGRRDTEPVVHQNDAFGGCFRTSHIAGKGG